MRSVFGVAPWLLLISLAQTAKIVAQPQQNLNLSDITNSTSTAILNRLTFREIIYAAVSNTQIIYPQALLREIEAVSRSGATTNPSLLTDIRIIFALPDQGPDKTLIVAMSDTWGRWLPPRLTPMQVPPREQTMPAWFLVDLEQANADKERAGFLGPYWSVIVGWPIGLPAESDQPMYMFQMESDSPGTPNILYVGASDGSVHVIYNAHQLDQPYSAQLTTS